MKKKLKKKKKIKKTKDKYSILFKEVEDVSTTEDYQRLNAALSLNEKKASIPDLIQAIDRVSNNVKLAGYLMITAKQEREKFRLRFKEASFDLEIKARKALAKLKVKEKLQGTITVDLIESYMIKHFREYRELKREEMKIRKMRDMLSIFFEAWRGKTSLLQTQAKLVDRRQGISVEEMERSGKKNG